VATARETDADTILGMDDAKTDGHVSLMHFGFTRGSDAAPFWIWPVLLLPPLFVGAATALWFRRREIQSAGAVIAEAMGVAAGFAIAAWAGALLAPSLAAGFLADDDLTVARFAVARPSVPATFGLALLLGIVGALVVASFTARTRGIALLDATSSLSTTSFCPSCGERVDGRAAFCGNCGTNLRETPRAPGGSRVALEEHQ
jgi:hypothetical protein